MQHAKLASGSNYLRQASHVHQTAPSVTCPVKSTESTNTACFQKGACIELSTGQIRRVEDIRTEDFIQSALRSVHFQLLESTIVKIEPNGRTMSAMITFSYDNGRQTVNMAVSMAHPLFVYGQGWASCNPTLSQEIYALRCQQLQVGDICISLTKRAPQEIPPPMEQPLPLTAPPEYQSRHIATEYSYRIYSEMANMVAVYTANCAQPIYD